MFLETLLYLCNYPAVSKLTGGLSFNGPAANMVLLSQHKGEYKNTPHFYCLLYNIYSRIIQFLLIQKTNLGFKTSERVTIMEFSLF